MNGDGDLRETPAEEQHRRQQQLVRVCEEHPLVEAVTASGDQDGSYVRVLVGGHRVPPELLAVIADTGGSIDECIQRMEHRILFLR